VLDHLKRRNRIEFGSPADDRRRPHAEHAFAMKGVHHRLGKSALLIAGVGMLVSDGANEPGAGRKIGCC